MCVFQLGKFSVFQLGTVHRIPVGYSSVCSSWVQFIVFQLGTVQCVPVGYSSVCSSWVQFSVFQLGTVHCVPFGYSSVCSSWEQFSVFQLGTVHCFPVGYSSLFSSWVQLTPFTYSVLIVLKLLFTETKKSDLFRTLTDSLIVRILRTSIKGTRTLCVYVCVCVVVSIEGVNTRQR